LRRTKEQIGKPEYKIKTVNTATRSSTQNAAIASSLVDTEARAMGAIDCAKEIVKEVLTKKEPEVPLVDSAQVLKDRVPGHSFSIYVERLTKVMELVKWTASTFGSILTALVARKLTSTKLGSVLGLLLGFTGTSKLMDWVMDKAQKLQLMKTKQKFATETFTYEDIEDEPMGDMLDARADVMALGKLKHKQSIGSVEYTKEIGFIPVIQRQINETTILQVSFETLAQLATPSNMSLNSTVDTAWERINHTARILHSVNNDKLLPVFNVNAVQDSVILAYGVARKMHQERENVNFPRPIASLTTPLSVMDTGMARYRSLLSSALKEMLDLIKNKQAWLFYQSVRPYLSVWDLMHWVWLNLILTP
jgi:hypothetical protein